MRIIVLTSRLDYAAERTLNQLLKIQGIEIVGVLKEKFSFSKARNIRKSLRIFEGMGLVYGLFFLSNFIVLQIGFILHILLYLTNMTKKWRSLTHLCNKSHIPIYPTRDINAKKTVRLLKKHRCDYFISINFGQKISKEVLAIPKCGSINVHPGLLPKYKGVLPAFWSVFKKEKHTGVTIHFMNEKIDEGKVIAQKKIKIRKLDSALKVFLKTTAAGANLLAKVLENIKKATYKKYEKIKTIHEEAKYYSLPIKNHLIKFGKNGGTLFRFKDLKHASYE